MAGLLQEEINWTRTENGALTYTSTGSPCLDLFASIGALRHSPKREILRLFQAAYGENRDLALKTLFFARDIRGGLGERRVFRIIFHWLALFAPEAAEKNLPLVPDYGRYDDLLELLGTPCEKQAVSFFQQKLEADERSAKEGQPVSLLAKWLPSVNASCTRTVNQARHLARQFHLTEREYRQLLTGLRREIHLLENHLRNRDYTFAYDRQPSKALFKYRQAFWRNDGERYQAFLDQVEKGEKKLHTGTLAPYDIVAPLVENNGFWERPAQPLTEEQRRSLDVTWNAQEDFTRGENALVVADGSGSMYGGSHPLPAAVAQSLAVYFAERNRGPFRNRFITFSEHPRLVEIKGRDIAEKIQYTMSFNEVANTDLQGVFDLLLREAVRKRMTQEELPQRLYVISDMEFDAACCRGEGTNFQRAREKFRAQGYELPQVIFWNVDSRTRQQPVTQNQQGAVLVSGCSPQIFQMIREGNLDPMAFMLEVLGQERYRPVGA
ncbi:DUF2828 family protein [Acidaminococcus massiliensis]|uniref:DUF2828 family protein n=1 Tax=Acidaminococcus massiliensis TaxID=1852375 RepID=UPI00094E2EAB|nr:DUF2828 family protein [Acidaminococcus massiliensis]